MKPTSAGDLVVRVTNVLLEFEDGWQVLTEPVEVRERMILPMFQFGPHGHETRTTVFFRHVEDEGVGTPRYRQFHPDTERT